MEDLVYRDIARAKIVAIIRGLSIEDNLRVIQTLIESGINNLEVTLNTESALDIIKEARLRYGNRAHIGAGTVTNEEKAKMAIEAGAEFIVTPNFSKEVVKVCKHNNKLIIPGVFSPTEMMDAYELGCKMIKLFPAITLGTNFIKQVKAPFNNINIMAVGGINLENINEFFQSGADAVGVGGSLIREDYIKAGRYDLLKSHFILFKESMLK